MFVTKHKFRLEWSRLSDLILLIGRHWHNDMNGLLLGLCYLDMWHVWTWLVFCYFFWEYCILLLEHVTNAMNRMMYFCSSFDILSLQLVMNVSTLMFPLPRSFFCENFEFFFEIIVKTLRAVMTAVASWATCCYRPSFFMWKWDKSREIWTLNVSSQKECGLNNNGL